MARTFACAADVVGFAAGVVADVVAASRTAADGFGGSNVESAGGVPVQTGSVDTEAVGDAADRESVAARAGSGASLRASDGMGGATGVGVRSMAVTGEVSAEEPASATRVARVMARRLVCLCAKMFLSARTQRSVRWGDGITPTGTEERRLAWRKDREHPGTIDSGSTTRQGTLPGRRY